MGLSALWNDIVLLSWVNAMKNTDIEIARKLFAQSCDFVLAAADPNQFPKSKVPEIAFVGRSNVGKSSLINALTNRKGLAHASNTPGRTQQIVFFDLAHHLMLVDLPGYGYAEAPRADKEHWNELVHHYLQTRPTLRCVLLLIDSRHGIRKNDLTMMRFLDSDDVSYQIVLTKTDQMHPAEYETRQRQTEARLDKYPAARSGVIMTSAVKKNGLEALQVFLTGLSG
jgi:GTP-binding protein